MSFYITPRRSVLVYTVFRRDNGRLRARYLDSVRRTGLERCLAGFRRQAYLPDHRRCPSFAACHRACSMSTKSKLYDPAIDGLNGHQNHVSRSILPRSTTWIYFYGAPPANIGQVAQLRFAVLLRRRCGGCGRLLAFASHLHRGPSAPIRKQKKARSAPLNLRKR